MDGLTLLAEAREADLTVEADGARLVVRGPKRAATVARRLLDQKPAVMEALQVSAGQEPTPQATTAADDMLAAADDALAVGGPEAATLGPGAGESGDDWSSESVELGEPCPECCGVLWWEDVEGGRHCLDCERAEFERSRELARLAQRLRGAGSLPPWEVETEAEPLPSRGLQCDRCKSTQFVEATTHGGRTVRLDCARCGRFVAWKAWYGKLLVENGN